MSKHKHYTVDEMVDLAEEMRRDEDRKRRLPSFWWGVWFGFKIGVLLTVVFFIVVSLCAR